MASPTISFDFVPRPYQRELLQARANGIKRLIFVAHRRAGKDLTFVSLAAVEALKRVGAYFYFFPTYNQGRKILWQGRDRSGRRFLDYIPKELVSRTNETEMLVEFVNGSTLQVVGTDRTDAIVGTNPVGCLFSEYSLQDPAAWQLVSPILRENGGWAAFCYTPRGRNHGYRLYKMAQSNPAWFCRVLPITVTTQHDGVTPVLFDSELDAMKQWKGKLPLDFDVNEDRKAGVEDAILQQEYFCSFEGSIQGSYYADLIRRLREPMPNHPSGRIASVPYDPAFPVKTYWDIGIDDSCAIWFAQFIGTDIRFIDYYEAHNQALDHYAKVLKEKPYHYDEIGLPHDARARDFTTGKSTEQVLRRMFPGCSVRVAKKLTVIEGINAVRRLFPRFWFDANRCEAVEYGRGLEHAGHSGLDALAFYSKEWDEDLHIYKETPKHDYTSHGADAMRTACLLIRDRVGTTRTHSHVITQYDPLAGANMYGSERGCDIDYNVHAYA